jgi:hypothetical protein
MGRLKKFFGIEDQRSKPAPAPIGGLPVSQAPSPAPVPNALFSSTVRAGQPFSLSVETHHGTVVAVWFRGCPLVFKQVEVKQDRALAMLTLESSGTLLPIENMTVRRRE